VATLYTLNQKNLTEIKKIQFYILKNRLFLSTLVCTSTMINILLTLLVLNDLQITLHSFKCYTVYRLHLKQILVRNFLGHYWDFQVTK